MCSAARSQPELLHRRLAVDDDARAIFKLEREDVAGAGKFDVDVGGIDRGFDLLQRHLGALEKFRFGHARFVRTMTGPRLHILGIAVALGLAGCGQKGPLYLPPPVAAPQSRPPSDTPAERPSSRALDGVPSTSETR